MFEKQLKELRENNKERKFTQTADLFINFVQDSKRKLNVTGTVHIPHGKGKGGKVCVFTDSLTNKVEETGGVDVITKDQFSSVDAKKIVDEYDSFLAEAQLMLDVGKYFGPVFAPKGKMPKPFTAGDDIKKLISSGDTSFPIKITKNVIHLVVGNEEFTDQQLDENLDSIISFLEKNLPKGRTQIKSAYLKFTMSPTVRLI